MQIYRQGDVLLIKVKNDSTACAEEITADRGRIVLAYGEATGHAHALDARLAALFAIAGTADRLLRAKAGARLLHEEHGYVDLPEGDYLVRQQREYSPEEIRNVSD